MALKHDRLIAFEGIDQAGKRTQSTILARRLSERNYGVEVSSFPVYSTNIGAEIRLFLDGKASFPFEAAHLLLSANRWEMKEKIENWLDDGKWVIVDRYIYSNYAYGGARGIQLGWLKALDAGLPEPRLTFLIDISPETSLRRKKSKRDINEADLKFLSEVRRIYLELSRKMRWCVLEGERGMEEIAEEVWAYVQKRLKV